MGRVSLYLDLRPVGVWQAEIDSTLNAWGQNREWVWTTGTWLYDCRGSTMRQKIEAWTNWLGRKSCKP